MSKSLAIILLVTFALTLTVPVSGFSSLQRPSATPDKTEFLTYENPNSNIKMQYPSSWNKDLNVSSPDLVTFYPSAVKSNASFTVKVDNISDEMSVPQYASDSNDAIRKRTQDFSLVESSTNNTLAGLPVYKSVYIYAGDNNSTVRGTEIGVIKGDKVYIFTYEAGQNEYYTYLPTIRNMIYSFQITTSQISPQPNAIPLQPNATS